MLAFASAISLSFMTVQTGGDACRVFAASLTSEINAPELGNLVEAILLVESAMPDDEPDIKEICSTVPLAPWSISHAPLWRSS